MAITRIQAQKLCNDAEMQLVAMSLGDALKALSPVQLRGKLKRARTLRDKHADKFKRQTVATQADTGTKRGDSGAANARTQMKLQLFDEVLGRFETRSAQLEAQAARAAASAAKAAAKAGAAKSAPRQAAAPKTSVKTAVKAALKSARKSVVSPEPAAAKRSARAAAVKRATAVSPVVAVRGKAIGAHARSAQARSQAKRDKR